MLIHYYNTKIETIGGSLNKPFTELIIRSHKNMKKHCMRKKTRKTGQKKGH